MVAMGDRSYSIVDLDNDFAGSRQEKMERRLVYNNLRNLVPVFQFADISYVAIPDTV